MRLLILLIPILFILGCNQAMVKIDGRQVMSSEDLKSMIQKGNSIFIKDAVFKENIHFEQITRVHVTGKGNAITEIPVSIVFENCVFMGKITAHSNLQEGVKLRTQFTGSLSFEGCLFEKPVRLNGAIFKSPGFWRKNLFRADVDITGALFDHHFSFTENMLDGQFRSNQTRFRSSADFFGSEFNGITFLQGSIFSEDALFLNTTFNGSLDFTLSRVFGGLYFNHSKINGRALFNGSKWSDRVEFNSVDFKSTVEFKRVEFIQRPEFHKANFKKTPDFQDASILIRNQFHFS